MDKKHEEHLKMVDEIVKYVNVTNGHEITKKLSKEKEKRIMKVLDEWYSELNPYNQRPHQSKTVGHIIDLTESSSEMDEEDTILVN